MPTEITRDYLLTLLYKYESITIREISNHWVARAQANNETEDRIISLGDWCDEFFYLLFTSLVQDLIDDGVLSICEKTIESYDGTKAVLKAMHLLTPVEIVARKKAAWMKN